MKHRPRVLERSRPRTTGVALSAIALLSVLAATSASAAPSGRSGSQYIAYPSSIAVLGHSGATGENSDPGRPGVEVRANSWATGTNPAVKSVYLRILAQHAGIKGHNVN